MIGAKRVELAEDLVGRPQLVPLEVAGVPVAELGGDVPLVAAALDGLADEPFGDVVAVALGGVEEVDAEFAAALQDGAHLVDLVVAPPLAPELPGADSDDGAG